MLEVRDRRKQTYFSSAVWAAMRVRSDLSARGQPDRLEDRLERERQKTRLRTGCLSMSEGKSQNLNWTTEPGQDWAAHTQGRTGVLLLSDLA